MLARLFHRHVWTVEDIAFDREWRPTAVHLGCDCGRRSTRPYREAEQATPLPETQRPRPQTGAVSPGLRVDARAGAPLFTGGSDASR